MKRLMMMVLLLLSLYSLAQAVSAEPVIVAVFDSGIDATHPLLKNHLWTNPREIPNNQKDDDGNGIIDDVHGVNFFSNNGDVSDLSPNGHGTHVSGLALGFHKTISSEIQIMPLVINPNNPGLSLLKSLEYAQVHGALLFSISFSQPRDRLMTPDEIAQTPTSQYETYITLMNQFYSRNIIIRNQEDFVYFYNQYQHDFGDIWNKAMEKIQSLQNKMLIIASSGNDGLDLNNKHVEPATLPFSNIISVMNLDHEYLPFSLPVGKTNYGTQKIYVGAVGTNVLSTAPRGGFARLTGSSQAVPKITHECAKIALALQQQNIAPTPQRIKERLLESLPTSETLKQYTITGKYLSE